MTSPIAPRFVYLIGVAGLQAVKIGSASDPEKRMIDCQVGCPLPLALLWKRAAPNAVLAEKALHRRFDECRVRGEWFNLGLDPVPVVDEAFRAVIADLPAVDPDFMPVDPLPPLMDLAGQRIISDLKAVWGEDRQLPTAVIVERLVNIPDSPWAHLWSDAEGVSSGRGLSSLLAPHRVAPVKIRVGEKTLWGYRRKDFPADVWVA